MPKLTISEAARIVSVPRSTIYRKIKSGELSCEVLDGRKVVDPSELQRVFPSDRPIVKHATSKDSPMLQNGKEGVATAEALQIATLQDHIATLQEANKVLQKDKDRLLTLLETKMITDQREQSPEPSSDRKKKKKSKKNKKGKKK